MSGWISVYVGLPLSNDQVLICDSVTGLVDTGSYGFTWHWDSDLDWFNVTHWMPFPEAPKP